MVLSGRLLQFPLILTCGLRAILQAAKIVDIDAQDVGNDLAVVEYVEEIYKFYKSVEVYIFCGIKKLREINWIKCYFWYFLFHCAE